MAVDCRAAGGGGEAGAEQRSSHVRAVRLATEEVDIAVVLRVGHRLTVAAAARWME